MTDAKSEPGEQNVMIVEKSDGTLSETYHTKMCAVICKRFDHTHKPTAFKPLNDVEGKEKCKLCEDIEWK